MNKSGVSKFFSGVQTSLAKHSPEILTGLGIAGMITTTVLAVRATPKALKRIEEEKDRQSKKLCEEALKNGEGEYAPVDKLKVVDTVKVTWKCYIPAVITGVVSTACLIGASSVHVKRNAVLATAYKLSESALADYREKVIETVGEKKEQAIRDKVAKDCVDKNPASKTDIIVTGNGTTKCLDYSSKRYFYSDIDKIKRAVNEINRQMLHEGYISLNDFYDELGLGTSKIYDRMGWNTDDGLIELHFSSQLDENGTPCLVIDFEVPPKYDFDRFF